MLAILLLLITNILCANDQATLFDNKPDAHGERAIVIVTASYNNRKWYKQNLDSIFSQHYSNYRVIYVDDCSPDNTGDLVEQYIEEKGQQHRVTLIKNKERRRALANLYYAITSCADNEIVALVDGDDFLAHKNVLATLNKTYANNDIWLAYSQFKMVPSESIGWGQAYPEEIIQRNEFRQYGHTPTHLRTFYAGLFKKINREDLMQDGDFFRMTYDMAMMLPMVEMARNGHYAFIPDVLYLYNEMNAISDHVVDKDLQRSLDLMIRSKKRYNDIIYDFDILMGKWTSYYTECLQDNSCYAMYLEDKKTSELYTFFKALYQKNCSQNVEPDTNVRIPKIIHQIWLGGPVPEAYTQWIESWRKLHPDWQYKLWTDETVKSLTLHNQDYYDNAYYYGEKSNILRYELLYQFGGVYVDIDFECLQPLDDLHYKYDFYCGLAPLDAKILYINNALIGSKPGHPILEHCIKTIEQDKKNEAQLRSVTGAINVATGAIHFTKSFLEVVKQADDNVVALPTSMLYPLPHQFKNSKDTVETILKKHREVYAVHYWAGNSLKIVKKVEKG